MLHNWHGHFSTRTAYIKLFLTMNLTCPNSLTLWVLLFEKSSLNTRKSGCLVPSKLPSCTLLWDPVVEALYFHWREWVPSRWPRCLQVLLPWPREKETACSPSSMWFSLPHWIEILLLINKLQLAPHSDCPSIFYWVILKLSDEAVAINLPLTFPFINATKCTYSTDF